MTTPELVTQAKVAARNAVDSLTGPDDDIIPVVISNGRRGVDIMGVVMPADDSEKDALADTITARIAIAQATEAAMVTTAYISTLNPHTHEISGRQETVVLFYCNQNTQRAGTAKLTRHDNRPPDMSIWEEFGEGATLGGRFAQCLTSGLAFANAVDSNMQEVLDEGWDAGREDDLVKMFLAAKATLESRN